LLTILVIAAIAAPAIGHGVPINVSLNADNRLAIQPDLEAGDLNLVVATLITTDLPGIGIENPDNGVPDGTQLQFDVLQGLYYWDGTDVVPTGATLLIDSPVIDGFGHANTSPVETYQVTHASPPQSGMRWGTYDANPPGWDSHGTYSLLPITAQAGVYATVVRIAAANHKPTDPFVLAFAFDPLGRWSETEIAAGVSAIASAATPAGDADGDGDVDFDDIGAMVLSLNDPAQYGSDFGVSEAVRIHRGDLNGDGDVDFDDIPPLVAILSGAQAFASHAAALGGVVWGVPEPAPRCLVGLAVAVLVGVYWRRTRTTQHDSGPS